MTHDRSTDDRSTPRLMVLGAGVMGTGIATLAIARGVPVLLIDPDEDRLAHARNDVRRQLRITQLMGAMTGPMGDLRTASEPRSAVDSTLVVEAVSERLELKKHALTSAGAAVAPGTPFASNTSSIPIDELADALPRPGDLVGAHFMNPPYLIPTVEVVRGPRTDPAAVAAVTAVLERLDRRPVVVGDGPGFVTSRLLHPMINAAARVVEQGTATADEVDMLMRDCLGHPTGPLRTADLIGLDNLVDSLWRLHERTGVDACRPTGLLLAKVRAGDLGRKSGRGFYVYQEAMR